MTRQQRSTHTRLRLLNAAADLFDRNGYTGSSLDEVTRLVGMTKGALYFHFASKNDICAGVQAEACAMLELFLSEQNDQSPVQSLINLGHTLVDWLTDSHFIRASFRIARECGDQDTQFLRLPSALSGALHALVRQADETGELDGQVTRERAASLIIAVCFGIVILWWAGIPRDDLQYRLTGIWMTVLPGIVGQARACELDPQGTHQAAY